MFHPLPSGGDRMTGGGRACNSRGVWAGSISECLSWELEVGTSIEAPQLLQP